MRPWFLFIKKKEREREGKFMDLYKSIVALIGYWEVVQKEREQDFL